MLRMITPWLCIVSHRKPELVTRQESRSESWLDGGQELVRSIISLYKKVYLYQQCLVCTKPGRYVETGVEIRHAIPVNRGVQINQRRQDGQIDLTPVVAGLEALTYHFLA